MSEDLITQSTNDGFGLSTWEDRPIEGRQGAAPETQTPSRIKNPSGSLPVLLAVISMENLGEVVRWRGSESRWSISRWSGSALEVGTKFDDELLGVYSGSIDET